MGNGNAKVVILARLLERLLTPHGERERRQDRRYAPGLSPPNPSWGTGTRNRINTTRHVTLS